MKTILMTGATGGLGFEASLHLAKSDDHKLVILGRDTQKFIAWKSEFSKRNGRPSNNVDFIECDLSSLRSVKQAIEKVKSKYDHIDILLNNAGLWNKRFHETEDGIEETFQVNLLAPYILIKELAYLLRRSSDPRVVNTSSGLHQGTIKFNDPEFRKSFSGFSSYRQSKLGMMLLSRSLASNEEYNPIAFYSQHPGMVSTDLGQHIGGISNSIFKMMGIHPFKGAQNLIHLATVPKTDLVNGEYYYKCKVKRSSTKASNDLSIGNRMIDLLEEYKQRSFDTIQSASQP